MKKLLFTAIKCVAFFLLWLLLVAATSLDPVSEPGFLWATPGARRLWWELLPLVATLVPTLLFWAVLEKRRLPLPLCRRPLATTLLSLLLGAAWLGTAAGILLLTGGARLEKGAPVPTPWLWWLAVLVNVIMQEYLVRGYLFSLLRRQYGPVAAIVVSTLLFTAMHGGAFEAGWLAVANVAAMSLFVSLLLLYARGLLAPIVVHFVWNGAGRLLLGAISLADDYPSRFHWLPEGGKMLSGGQAGLEGSLVVFVLNLALAAGVLLLLYRRRCSVSVPTAD